MTNPTKQQCPDCYLSQEITDGHCPKCGWKQCSEEDGGCDFKEIRGESDVGIPDHRECTKCGLCVEPDYNDHD